MATVAFESKSRGYAHPEMLVSTEWVAEHRADPTVGWWRRTRTSFSMTWATSLGQSSSTGTPSCRTPYDISPDQEVISYCRIGERSSHTWFVLKYLLGYPRVKNYNGSWTEWGNLVAAPIEK